MIRLRDPGAEMIVDTPSMASAEIANGGKVEFATAGYYEGDFQVLVGFEGQNSLGVSEVTHRVNSNGEGWSNAIIRRGSMTQMLPIDSDVQARALTYEGKHGVELLGVSDSSIPSFISTGSLAIEAALPDLQSKE